MLSCNLARSTKAALRLSPPLVSLGQCCAAVSCSVARRVSVCLCLRHDDLADDACRGCAAEPAPPPAAHLARHHRRSPLARRQDLATAGRWRTGLVGPLRAALRGRRVADALAACVSVVCRAAGGLAGHAGSVSVRGDGGRAADCRSRASSGCASRRRRAPPLTALSLPSSRRCSSTTVLRKALLSWRHSARLRLIRCRSAPGRFSLFNTSTRPRASIRRSTPPSSRMCSRPRRRSRRKRPGSSIINSGAPSGARTRRSRSCERPLRFVRLSSASGCCAETR